MQLSQAFLRAPSTPISLDSIMLTSVLTVRTINKGAEVTCEVNSATGLLSPHHWTFLNVVSSLILSAVPAAHLSNARN